MYSDLEDYMEEAAQRLQEREDHYLPARTTDLEMEVDMVVALYRHVMSLSARALSDRTVCEEVLLASFHFAPSSRLRFFFLLARNQPVRYAAIIDAVDGAIRLGALTPLFELSRMVLAADIFAPERLNRVEERLRRAA